MQNETRVLKNLFPTLSAEAISQLLLSAKIVEYPPRHELCRQGEYADKFYILLSGTVGVYAEIGDEMYQVDKIRHGCFGEIALLLDRRRTAFIYTKEETQVIEMDRSDFFRFTTAYPDFANAIAKIVIERLVEQDRNNISKLEATKQRDREQDKPINYVLGEYTFVRPVFGPPPKDKQYETDILMLMPFRDDLTAIYENHIKRVANKLHLIIKRADDFFTQHSIVSEIWAVANASKLVIADCTTKNPNVFYELGIAHTLGKPTIPITQLDEDIPFDIRQWRHIRYEPTVNGMANLERELEEAIVKMLRLG